MLTRRRLLAAILAAVLLYSGLRAGALLLELRDPAGRRFIAWWRGDEGTRAALVTVQREACPGAPFILPADGFIGLLYADSRGPYSTSRPHQGIDIFSADDPGVTPVYAAYDGFVTRESSWVSSLIQRVPDDPLQPGRQLWYCWT